MNTVIQHANATIRHWHDTYIEYLTHNEIEGDLENMWVQRSTDLIAFWLDSECERGVYANFEDFLNRQVDYYARMNEDYRRDHKKRKHVTGVKGNGGRWCI